MSEYDKAEFTLKNSTKSTITLEDPNGSHSINAGETSDKVEIDSKTVITFYGDESLESQRMILPLDKSSLKVKIYKIKEGTVLKRQIKFKLRHSDRPKDLNVEIIDPE